MKTELFRKIVQTWRATSLLLLATAPAFAQMTVCDGQGYTLRSASGKEAAGIGDSPLTFTWYVSYNNNNDTEIENSNAESITIPGNSAGTYKYTRWVASVECPDGVSTTPYTVVVHPLPVVTQSSATALCSSGSHTLEVEASVDGGVSVAWYTDANLSGGTVSNTTSCTVSASTVVGTYTYYVQATANITQCKAAATVTATRTQTEGEIGGWRLPGAIGETATFTDPRDSQTYTVVKMPDNRIWFAQNLNYQKGLTRNETYGVANGAANTTTGSGTYAIGSFWCPGASNASSTPVVACETYGALYAWETAMMVDGNYNNVDESWSETWVSSYYYASGSGAPGRTENANKNNARGGGRGICPPGWHVPTAYEWAVMLDKVEGVTDIAVAGTATLYQDRTDQGSAGTTAGHLLKSAGAGSATDTQPLWSTGDGADLYGFAVRPSGYRTLDTEGPAPRGAAARYWNSTSNNGWYANAYGFTTDEGGVLRYEMLRGHGYNVRCVGD